MELRIRRSECERDDQCLLEACLTTARADMLERVCSRRGLSKPRVEARAMIWKRAESKKNVEVPYSTSARYAKDAAMLVVPSTIL